MLETEIKHKLLVERIQREFLRGQYGSDCNFEKWGDLWGGGIDLTKNVKKGGGGGEKLMKGRGA